MSPYLIIGILLSLGGLGTIAIFVLIARWRLHVPKLEAVAAEDFPPEEIERLRDLAGQLAGVGMVFAGLQHESRGPRFGVWQAVYRTGDGSVWAVAEQRNGEQPRLIFHSFFRSGRCATTANGEFADYNVSDEWRLQEKNCRDFDEQAKFHRQIMLGGGSDLMSLTEFDEFQARYLQVARRQFEQLVLDRFLVAAPGSNDAFKVRPWRNVGMALRILMHSKRIKWADKQREFDERYQAKLDAEAAMKRKPLRVIENGNATFVPNCGSPIEESASPGQEEGDQAYEEIPPGAESVDDAEGVGEDGREAVPSLQAT